MSECEECGSRCVYCAFQTTRWKIRQARRHATGWLLHCVGRKHNWRLGHVTGKETNAFCLHCNARTFIPEWEPKAEGKRE